MPPTTALELDRVTREFIGPNGAAYRALADISLTVSAGAFVAIIGPSGCGKSTLLNLAAGLIAPTSGRVLVDGEPLDGLNRRATYMFQQDALLPWKDVRDNVALGLRLAAVPRVDAQRRAQEWLERVGLTAFASHYPSQLSGGMRKRVGMAQNWIIERSMLLMDEPFSSLDVHMRHQMESQLLTLWEAARRTVVFVTHDLEEAISLADEVVVLSAGPESRVVARQRVTLERPRNILELRTTEGFAALYKSMWSVLREQVARSQQS